MLLGVKYQCTVGEVEQNHRQEVHQLVSELSTLITTYYPHIIIADNLEERLCGYARAVANYPTAMKEYPWRNGWFVSLAQNNAATVLKEDPCPLHTQLLQEIGILKNK